VGQQLGELSEDAQVGLAADIDTADNQPPSVDLTAANPL